MTKKIILLMLFLSLRIFAVEEMGILEIVDHLVKKSGYAKTGVIEENILSIEEKGLFHEEWGTVQLNLRPQYLYYYDIQNNGFYWNNFDPKTGESDIHKYQGRIELNLNYKFLYLNVTYEHVTNKIERNGAEQSYEYGIQKNLNDLFYNDLDYRKKSLELRKKGLEVTISRETKRLIEETVDRYRDIKNLEIEKDIQESIFEDNRIELENMKNSLKIGEGVELDIEYLEIDQIDLEEDIKILAERIEIEKKRLFDEIGLKYSKDLVLDGFEDVEYREIKLNNEDIRENELQMELAKEDMKRIKRESQVSFDFGAMYDPNFDRWRVFLGMNRGFTIFNSDLATQKERIKRIVIEENSVKKLAEDEKERRELVYQNLLKNKDVRLKRKKNMEKRYKLSDKLYKKGYYSFLEYINIRNDYKRAELEYEQSRNSLNSFKYKILFMDYYDDFF